VTEGAGRPGRAEQPTLSVCVPTFDRAELLALALHSLCSQVGELEGVVEIVVSDNCSSDDTADVVARMRESCPITYHRNERNIGQRNLVEVVRHASGEYCWIVGDDDMVARGALPLVVDALRANPDVDYFLVNFALRPVSERDRLIRDHDSEFSPSLVDCVCREPGQRRVDSWEELFDIETVCPSELFTAMVCNVLRRSRWLEYARTLRFGGAPVVSAADRTLDDTFPHVKVIAQAMAGRPAYYIGHPCVLMGQGSQEWLSDWPVISMVGINDALDLYEQLGVDLRRLEVLRESFFRQSMRFMPLIGAKRDLPCLRDFSFSRFAWRNRRYWYIAAPLLLRRLESVTRRRAKAVLPTPLFGVASTSWRFIMHRGGRGGEQAGDKA
jgi:hypothetical protein